MRWGVERTWKKWEFQIGELITAALWTLLGGLSLLDLRGLDRSGSWRRLDGSLRIRWGNDPRTGLADLIWLAGLWRLPRLRRLRRLAGLWWLTSRAGVGSYGFGGSQREQFIVVTDGAGFATVGERDRRPKGVTVLAIDPDNFESGFRVVAIDGDAFLWIFLVHHRDAMATLDG